MSRIDELAHEMAEAANKAALHWSLGEYTMGDHFAKIAQRADVEMTRLESVTAERATVQEMGVS